jgi:hypothetical protein
MTGNDGGRREAGMRQVVGAGRDSYAAARDIYVAGAISVNQALPPPAAGPVRAWGDVPVRNAAFAGREAQLGAIRESLLSGRPAAARALHGMGGVGKTQLAIEYAHRFAGEYDVVWWLDSENVVLLAQQYADLALAIGCAGPGAPQEVVRRAVRSDLHQRPGWLVIFDNAADPGSLRDWLPSGPGHVLITSRSAAWAELAVPVPVGVLARAESVELLRKRVPGLAGPDAVKLAEALGDLPLAMAQAGAYLAEARLPAGDYVALLEDRAADLLCEGKPATYRDTLASVTTLAYDQLRSTDEDAAGLAAICAFLAPEPVPVHWLVNAAARLPGGLGARLGDPMASRALLAALTRTALARLDDAGLTMHRLTQAIIRARVLQDAACPAPELAVAAVTASAPGDPNAPRAWPCWAPVMPHLAALDPATSGSSELRSLAAGAVRYLVQRGDAPAALAMARELRAGWAARFPAEDRLTLSVRNAMVGALSFLGRLAEARAEAEHLLAGHRRAFGDDDPGTLTVASNLANNLRDLGQHEDARRLDEDTLARSRRALGDDHPETLRSASNLAADLCALGSYDAAVAIEKDAWPRSRRMLGDDHPETLRSAGNLADAYRGLGQHQAARELDEDTLERGRRALGDDHPRTLWAAFNLAADLREMGAHQAARELDEETLQRRRRVLGEDHPLTTRSAESLAKDIQLLGGPA